MPTRSATVAAACARIGCDAATYEAHVDAGEAFCSACRQWLAADAFHSAMHRSTGAQDSCRWCRSRATMLRRYGVRMTLQLVREARDLYWSGAHSERLAARYGEDRAAMLRALGGKHGVSRLRADDVAWLRGVGTQRAA